VLLPLLRGRARWAAVALAALLACHPLVLFAATFVRMYALVFALGALLPLCIRALSGDDRRRRLAGAAGVALLGAAGIYTSYFALLAGAGVALWAALWLARPATFGLKGRQPAVWLLGAGGAGALLAAPWIPVILRLLSAESNLPATDVSRASEFLRLVRDLCGSWAGGAVLLAGWAMALRGEEGRREWLGPFLGMVVVPVALLFALTPAGRPLDARYVIFSLPVLWSGAAAGIVTLLAGRRRAGAAAGLAACLLAFHAWTARTGQLAPKPDWWAVAAILERDARPGDVVLTGGYLSGEAVVYHLREPDRFEFLHYVTKLDQFTRACANPRVAWFVNAAPLPDAYRTVVEVNFPRRIHIEGNGPMGGITVASKRPFSEPPSPTP